jgi:hypothetical protein
MSHRISPRAEPKLGGAVPFAVFAKGTGFDFSRLFLNFLATKTRLSTSANGWPTLPICPRAKTGA